MPLCEVIHVERKSGGPKASMPGISSFVEQLAGRCPAMRSIWVIGSRADGGVPEAQGPFDWDLVAFADAATLRALRRATDLHRTDVLLRIVTDGDRFEVAWGRPHICGSLFQWDGARQPSGRRITRKRAGRCRREPGTSSGCGAGRPACGARTLGV